MEHEKTLPESTYPKWEDFRAFMENLISDPANRRIEKLQEWRDARQGHGQSVREFVGYLEKLAPYIEDLTDGKKADTLYLGLRKPIQDVITTQPTPITGYEAMQRMAERVERTLVKKGAHNDDGQSSSGGRVLKGGRKRMIVTVVLTAADQATRKVSALVDSGAEVNCISPMFAKELRWEIAHIPPRTIKGYDGHEMMTFGTYQEAVEVTDSLKRTKRQECQFYAIEGDEFPLILGYPWLEDVDPMISFRSKHWSYPDEELPSSFAISMDEMSEDPTKDERNARPVEGREPRNDFELAWRHSMDTSDIEVVSPEKLESVARDNGQRIYAIVVSGVGSDKTLALRVNAMTSEDHPKVPGWLSDYAEVFDEAKAAQLPPLSDYTHAIDTGDEELPYGPLYN
ncbi:hypothetical protein DV737_g5812, partial [Chaetothyriales sp. CBS 132003]